MDQSNVRRRKPQDAPLLATEQDERNTQKRASKELYAASNKAWKSVVAFCCVLACSIWAFAMYSESDVAQRARRAVVRSTSSQFVTFTQPPTTNIWLYTGSTLNFVFQVSNSYTATTINLVDDNTGFNTFVPLSSCASAPGSDTSITAYTCSFTTPTSLASSSKYKIAVTASNSQVFSSPYVAIVATGALFDDSAAITPGQLVQLQWSATGTYKYYDIFLGYYDPALISSGQALYQATLSAVSNVITGYAPAITTGTVSYPWLVPANAAPGNSFVIFIFGRQSLDSEYTSSSTTALTDALAINIGSQNFLYLSSAFSIGEKSGGGLCQFTSPNAIHSIYTQQQTVPVTFSSSGNPISTINGVPSVGIFDQSSSFSASINTATGCTSWRNWYTCLWTIPVGSVVSAAMYAQVVINGGSQFKSQFFSIQAPVSLFTNGSLSVGQSVNVAYNNPKNISAFDIYLAYISNGANAGGPILNTTMEAIVLPIASNAAAQGPLSFSWTVPTTLPNGTSYAIKMYESSSDAETFQDSSKLVAQSTIFNIIGSKYGFSPVVQSTQTNVTTKTKSAGESTLKSSLRNGEWLMFTIVGVFVGIMGLTMF